MLSTLYPGIAVALIIGLIYVQVYLFQALEKPWEKMGIAGASLGLLLIFTILQFYRNTKDEVDTPVININKWLSLLAGLSLLYVAFKLAQYMLNDKLAQSPVIALPIIIVTASIFLFKKN
jgi:hypothetical protein